MPKKSSAPKPLPGLQLSDFRAAVESLASLRDAGKWMVFIPQSGGVRFIGDETDFASEYAKLVGRDVTSTDVSNITREVRLLMTLALKAPKLLADPDFVLHAVYRASETSRRKELAALINDKIQVLRSKLIRPSMESRISRLRTAVAPCLEELESELVTRRDTTSDKAVILGPFARLRIRYTQSKRDGSLPRFIFPPDFLASSTEDAEAFEIEVDETDIDLLIQRLTEAKQSLLDSEASRGLAP